MKVRTDTFTKPAAQWVKDQLALANERVVELTFRIQQLKVEVETLKKENLELRSTAQIDAKTRVLTLEGFTRHTRAAIQHAFGRRTGVPHHEALAVLYLDIDNFGRVNKEHGEPAGDECLRAVVAFLRRTVRDTDVIARNSHAADEFIVAFPNATAEDVVTIFARLPGCVHGPSLTVRYRDRLIDLTLSGGLTDYRPGEQLTETVLRANLAMRHVKANLGKSRLEIYADGVTPDKFPRHRPHARRGRPPEPRPSSA